MSYVRSGHLLEGASYVDFGRAQSSGYEEVYTDVVPVVQTLREITAGGFALILTTLFLHIYEFWVTCNACDGGYIILDYEGLVNGPGVFQDVAIQVGQTLVMTDVLSPTDPANPGAAPFVFMDVPGVNDTASFTYSIIGPSIL